MILNSPYISGSLTVTGNTTIQGQLTVTGSLSGTASLASNALLLQGTGSTGFSTTSSLLEVSSSQQQISSSQQQISSSYIALSGSYNVFSASNSTILTAVSSSQQQISSSYIALSASYNTFSGSASTRVTQIEQVYATTGSNSFRATQSITGSLTVTGQIIAQTINVQQVTSSIIYSSGSNNFGCDLNSRQTFTGSVLITGSLTIAGASSATSYSGTTIYGSTAVCSPVGLFSGCVNIGTAGSEKLNIFGAGSQFINIKNTTSAADMFVGMSSALAAAFIGTGGTDPIVFSTAGSEKMRITNGGNVGIGCTTPGYALDVVGQIRSTTSSNISGLILSNITAGSYSQIMFDGNNADAYIFKGNSTYSAYGGENSFNIYNEGPLAFHSSTITNIMFMTAAGLVGIGTCSPQSSYKVTISGTDTIYPAIYLENTTNSQAYSIRATGTNFSIRDNTSGNDRITLTSAGLVGIGTVPNTVQLDVKNTQTGTVYPVAAFRDNSTNGNALQIQVGNGEARLRAVYYSTITAMAMTFWTGDSSGAEAERMRITGAGITCFGYTVCAPCFATISDYRMKSNVRPIEGLSIIMKTKPYKFEYNYDCSTSFGMIAHELQDALPEAVFGQKDGEVMQGVDYMKLLPIAIKAIQELKAEIDELKNK